MAKTPSAPTAPVRASDELEALHAALDSRLAALEAALADPNECALEPLILDLARTATQEAEANARKLSAQARAEADQQAGSALSQLQVAEAALESERHAGLELHRSLGAARSELEAAKQKVATHTNDLDRMRSELSEAERCFAAADTLRQQADEARIEEVARERATVQRLTDALAQARSEIDAARQDVASRAADMEAARERADTAARNHADLTQAVNEARARLEAIGQERDRLKTELETARQNVATSAMALQSATVSAATERTAIEQKWHDAEARATAITRERDGFIAERDAVAGQLEAARHGSTTAAAAAQAIETQRAALEQSLRAVEQSLRDVESRNQALAHERDSLIAERDAAQAKGKALVAELTAAQTKVDVLAAEFTAAQAKGDALVAELTAAQTKGDVLSAELTAAQAKGDALVAERDAAQARRDAAEAERRTALAQLDAARQGSTTATAAIQSLDAHRATIEQNWQSAEARSDAMARERDAAIAQRDAAVAERATAVASAEALRKAVGDAQETDRARFSELRQRTERQIQDLEAQLLGGPSIAAEEDGPEIDVSLDEADEAEAIEIEPVVLTAKSKAAAPTSRAPQAAPSAGQQPTRIASRHGFREPLEVKLDGETALLVDVSTAGAQVLSSLALKPNKLVKMLLPSSEAIILCKAKIIWARFEPPTPGKPVRYRAGMVFTQADPAALQVFITRHTGIKMTATPSEERKTGRLIPVPFSTAAAAAGQRTRRADSREPIASLDFNFPAQRRD